MKFGLRVKDKISQFEGIVTGVVEYITGCKQVLIQPTVKPDGDFVEARWFDEDRLVVFANAPVTIDIVNAGPDCPAPRK